MEYTFIAAFTTLFLIIDPIGNIPIFNAMLKDIRPGRSKIIIVRECFLAFILLSIFAFFGRGFMELLGLSQQALTIGGALVLMIIALRMLFPSPSSSSYDLEGGEPLLFPIAIPMLAGPSALATVMLVVDSNPAQIATWIGAIALVMIVSAAILVVGEKIQKTFGKKVTSAFEKLMGLILVVMAVQMFLSGLTGYLSTHPIS